MEGHILSTSGAALIAWNLEEERERGEGGGWGKRDWGFCGVVGFPTGWHLHFVSFTGRSSEPFCLVELLYKSWGGGFTEVQTADCNHGFELGVVTTED